jgi:hypothetical protein
VFSEFNEVSRPIGIYGGFKYRENVASDDKMAEER